MRKSSAVIGLLLLVGMSNAARAENPSLVAVDADAFGKCVDADATVTKVASGMHFLEGPVWMPAGYLLFSDNAFDRIHKYTPADGVTIFREPSHATNGNTTDNQGRLISCEQGIRSVTRTEANGSITVLVDKFEGKRFNSPNDVVVKSDDSVWFTDPPYGVPKGQKREIDHQWVYRLDPATKLVSAVVTDMDMPNGLCFNPDEKRLYVADSGKPRHVRVYDINTDHTATNGRVFCTLDKGVPDGMRIDKAGRLWTSAGDGIQIFAPEGKLIGRILVPESPANLCFGGADGHTLWITARHSLYKIEVKVHPARTIVLH